MGAWQDSVSESSFDAWISQEESRVKDGAGPDPVQMPADPADTDWGRRGITP